MIHVDDDDDDEDEDDKTNGDQAPSFVSRIQMIQNTLLVLDYGSFPHKNGDSNDKDDDDTPYMFASLDVCACLNTLFQNIVMP